MLRDSTVWYFIKDAEKIVKQDQVELYWCVLINLLSEKLGRKCSLERHAQRLLNTVINLLDNKVKEQIEKNFQEKFPNLQESSWGSDKETKNSIEQRIKQILKFS
jgi:hypothetical protein